MVAQKLHPAILDHIRELPNETPRNWVTEKKLRGLTGLEPKEQLREAVRALKGFERKGRRSA